MSLDYYVATPGLAFSIRVKLAKPASEGNLYGARVYVDCGKAATKDFICKKWFRGDENGDGSVDPNSEDVDTSKPDHYFWFHPGSTEHIIQGFYKSASQSQQFVFVEPSKKRVLDVEDDDYQENLRESRDSVGVIHVMICSVEGFKNRSDKAQRKANQANYYPQQASVPKEIDQKIQLVAKPGRVVERGEKAPKRIAILSNDIVHERRIVYNTFEGFSARGFIGRPSAKVNFFKGMPLNALEKEPMRKQAIMTFFRAVSAFRVDLTEKERLEDPQEQPEVETNGFVRVEDIVHFICENLSPAASYIICTGKKKERPRNYGEHHVQRLGASMPEKRQDYEEKEKGLVAYFRKEPGVFEMKKAGMDEARRPPESFKVKLFVEEILDDSDDEE